MPAAKAEDKPEPVAPQPETKPQSAPERAESDFPKVDFIEREDAAETTVPEREEPVSVDRADEETAVAPEPEAADERTEPAEEDIPEKQAPIQYGRGRSRRAEIKPESPDTKESSESEPAEEELEVSYSVDKQSFGRTKRKRVR